VILLDEPFSNLDAALRARCAADVQRILAEAGATAVFVTHDQEEALSLADEVAVMSAGRIVQLSAPRAAVPPSRGSHGRGLRRRGRLRARRAQGGVVDSDLGPSP
jgi:iron(III) transport system ATP-binding protein